MSGALVGLAMFIPHKRQRHPVAGVVEVSEANDCPQLESWGICRKEGMKCNGRRGKLSCPVEAIAYKKRQKVLAKLL